MKEKTDHDLLIEVNERTKSIEIGLSNHLSDHKKYMIMAWTTCIGLVITLITLLVKVV